MPLPNNPKVTMALGVSVVIVTLNGKARLESTLRHLSLQESISFEWEVLIIDNNSTDGTATFSEGLWSQFGSPCPLRIVQETRPGTMYARRRGIEEARYRYLLFCDDDNWLPPNYLNRAFALIEDRDHIAAVGGCGSLVFEKGFVVPSWIERFQNRYGCGPQGASDGDTTFDKGCLYTAGAILDRVWLEKLYASGFKSTLKGRDGKSLVAGEDTELTYALKAIGGKLYYDSALRFKHFMPSSRITWSYLLRLSEGIGFGNYLLKPYVDEKAYQFFKDFFIGIVRIIKSCIKITFQFAWKEGSSRRATLAIELGEMRALLSVLFGKRSAVAPEFRPCGLSEHEQAKS